MNNFKEMIIIFSDIDGTIIDKETYSFEESIKALKKVLLLKIPVILVSSKSFSEIELYREKMGIRDPFISENGGAIFIPHGYFKEKPEQCIQKGNHFIKELATPLSSLSENIKEFQNHLNNEIIFFTDLPAEEIRRISNLPLEEAELSKKREYDLPFIVKETSHLKDEEIFSAAERAHLNITKGGRYYHILSQSDKGKAVQYLKKEFSKYFKSFISVGLGDGPNDLEMLLEVDEPIVIKKLDGTYAQELLKELPSSTKTNKIGPAGWSEAITNLLTKHNIQI